MDKDKIKKAYELAKAHDALESRISYFEEIKQGSLSLNINNIHYEHGQLRKEVSEVVIRFLNTEKVKIEIQISEL